MTLTDAQVGHCNPELNRHMAELDGWDAEPQKASTENYPWWLGAEKPKWWFPYQIPNYCSDRNAVARLEDGLTDDEYEWFVSRLCILLINATGTSARRESAAPLLRVIAVLQVKKPEVFTNE